MNPRPQHKPSFKYLCITYDIKPEVLARESGLRPIIALALINGYGTTPEVAQTALSALNALKGTRYALSDINIELHQGKETP